MNCVTITNSNPFYKWDTSSGSPHLWIGDDIYEGPDSMIKDARYHFTSCLDQSEMETIKSAFT